MTADLRSSLPARRTRLIGRQTEVEAVRERLLHGDRRAVTLTGAAGTGKTTLALEVARSVESLMADGAWFVDLLVVPDVESVPRAMATALGLVDQDRPLLEALVDHLAARQALIVLDNCEHLLPALGAVVDALLDRGPDLRILATSRATLRVRDESVYPVAPFELPPPDVEDVGRLAGFEAIQLFVERASAVDAGFELTLATAPAVVSICRRLDGIPLAIELAAASTAALSPAEIDRRLEATGVLGGTQAPGAPAQRTMEAALDWSHALLDGEAQTLFRRLSVFAGGWSLEAAEHVGSLGAAGASVVPALARLVGHSLVVRESDGARSRYRMLAPIQEYAARHLAASDELGPASLAHATFFVGLTTSPYANVGQCLPEDLDRVAAEHENALAAIRFATQAGVVPLRLGLVMNLIPLWRVRGHLHLAVDQLQAALGITADDSYEHAVVRGLLAEFFNVLGEYDAADEQARTAETRFAAMGAHLGTATMLAQQGLAAAGRGEFEAALAAYDRARPMLETAGNDLTWAYWEAAVGRFELGLGNLAAAVEHLEEADRRFRLIPSWYHGRTLAMLGVVAHRRGEVARATTLLAEGLISLRAYGATVDAIGCVEDMARLAVDQGDGRRAATLLAAATGLRDATAAAGSVPERVQLSADVDRVRSALPTADFEAAWAAGVGMTLDQVLDFATAKRSAPLSGRASPGGDALTPREREIAGLVALGLSNRAIADRLVIAPGTVKIHVERILGKLGRTSRVQIATWVHAQPDRDGTAPSLAQDMPTGRRLA
ncbi:MAG TPA: LuxR C-terminal-related transcriptional regulator [Candidatus Limnocylindrales bacterium]|nr:LuxR C-terminal-related transcriptional regulator [Candidatus Limnocylindrales bacterium]